MMSVSREIIALENCVEPKMCNCGHCGNHEKISVFDCVVFCDLWEFNMYSKSFCSFFEPEEDV